MRLPDDLPEVGDLIEPKPSRQGNGISTTMVLTKPTKTEGHKVWSAIGYDLVHEKKIVVTFDVDHPAKNPPTCFFWVKFNTGNAQTKKR